MLRIMIAFFRGMLTLANPWLIWIGLLVVANMLVPLVFVGSLEAKVVLAAFMAGAVIQLAIFVRLGFVRLLGLGHILWIPLVIWAVGRLEVVGTGSVFGIWLAALIALNATSLVIDFVDVVRYLLGDREATYRLESA